MIADARKVIAKLGIPTVSTMISMDIVNESALNYGFTVLTATEQLTSL